jgi:predicted TPR repeat methyltransferase
MLDLGWGTGLVARGLVFVDHVDAVDFSQPMLDLARALAYTDVVELEVVTDVVRGRPAAAVWSG